MNHSFRYFQSALSDQIRRAPFQRNEYSRDFAFCAIFVRLRLIGVKYCEVEAF